MSVGLSTAAGRMFVKFGIGDNAKSVDEIQTVKSRQKYRPLIVKTEYIVESTAKYRAFHNVLRDYKHL